MGHGMECSRADGARLPHFNVRSCPLSFGLEPRKRAGAGMIGTPAVAYTIDWFTIEVPRCTSRSLSLSLSL